jgi:hypothetical protein
MPCASDLSHAHLAVVKFYHSPAAQSAKEIKVAIADVLPCVPGNANSQKIKRAKTQKRKQCSNLSPVIRDIVRKTQGHCPQQERIKRLLEWQAVFTASLDRRSECDRPNLCSVHTPKIDCIAKDNALNKV